MTNVQRWYRKLLTDPVRLERHSRVKKAYYQRNRERLIAKRKQYRLDNRELVLARNRAYRLANRERLMARSRQWWLNNRGRARLKRKEYILTHYNEIREERQAYRQHVKLEVFNHYGTMCACCKESNIVFLAIDHINGGGNQHRRENGIHAGVGFYRWLIVNNFPDDFQVLCYNCNWAKHRLGKCPHQDGLSTS